MLANLFSSKKKNQSLKNSLHSIHAGNGTGVREHLYVLDGVSMQYGNLKALSNVRLEVMGGEVLFITGASGAGKTTLLKLLSGDLMPSTGRIFRPGPRHFAAPVFQDLRLMSQMTCYENLLASYDKRLYRSRKDFDSDLEELCHHLGMNDRLHLKVREANGGLKQKVAIVRSLLTRPDIFIADEPTSSLDRDNARKIFDILNILNTRRGMTVIWASHSRDLVSQFTGRIIHLEKGKLIYSGHACFI